MLSIAAIDIANKKHKPSAHNSPLITRCTSKLSAMSPTGSNATAVSTSITESAPSASRPDPIPNPSSSSGHNQPVHNHHNSIEEGLQQGRLLPTKNAERNEHGHQHSPFSSSFLATSHPHPRLVYEDELLQLGFTIPRRSDESLLHLILHPFKAGHDHLHHHDSLRVRLSDVVEQATRMLLLLQELSSEEYEVMRLLALERTRKMQDMGFEVNNAIPGLREETIEEIKQRIEQVVKLRSQPPTDKNLRERVEHQTVGRLLEMVVDLGQDYLLWMASRGDDLHQDAG